jgi:quercetin dioxygenase-like cupin family protein
VNLSEVKKETVMTLNEFEKHLTTEAYGVVANVDKPAGYSMGAHQHPFDACALITAGDITLTVAGVTTRYGVGDIFRLAAGTPHSESAGAAGVSYRAGRRSGDGA